MKKILIILILLLLTGCNKQEKIIIDDKENIDIKVDNKETTNNTDNKETFDINNTNNINNEDDIINYFNNLKLTIKEKINNDTWDNTKEYISQAFNKIYGFFFKGEKIGNYTLSELSSTTKEKIINTILEIDTIIENKVPGYKNDFKESYNIMINSLKKGLELLKQGINNIFTE